MESAWGETESKNEFCPETSKLIALVRDESDSWEIESLLEHSETCPACHAELNRILQENASVSKSLLSKVASIPADTSDTEIVAIDWKQISNVKSIGKYGIRRKLGEGGMGEVFECYDEKLGRLVAVKRIKPSALSTSQLERLEREARIHARLDHPGIVVLYEFGAAEGLPYIVMELVDGGTLRDSLRFRRPNARQAASLLKQVAEAVHFAHGAGVLHRDLKPGNILLKPSAAEIGSEAARKDPAAPFSRTVKVSDFGLAKVTDILSEDSRSILFMGTPMYMAPEQLGGDGRKIGPGTDVYAMGVILYEMLTGRVPFESDSISRMTGMVHYLPPLSPREFVPGIPADLETIALKCLEKDPAHRYASAAKLADDLDRFLQNRPILARPIGKAGKLYRLAKRNPHEAVALGIAVSSLACLALSAFVFAQRQNRLRIESDHQKQVAQNMFLALRDKYFVELESVSKNFEFFRTVANMNFHPEEIVVDRKRLLEYSRRLIDERNSRAQEMIRMPELLDQKHESMVEAFYIAGLKMQETDQDAADKLFATAVERAKEISEERRLGETGRLCALNSANFRGVFRVQREDFEGGLKHFLDGWDHFRAMPDETYEDPRLLRFSLVLGANILEALEKVGRSHEISHYSQELANLRVPAKN